MVQWRIELSTQDIVALSDGREIVAVAIDQDQVFDEASTAMSTIDVTVSLTDL